jgi:pimeloyl-ACP methyl ester carboxylesterase
VGAGAARELSDRFLLGVENAITFATGPLYAVLHEPIYCQGTAARWSAARILGEYPEFALEAGRPVRFTGEMIYPWMFEEDGSLRPLRDAAEVIAARTDWPALYDAERLRANEVPCAAIAYHDDMYVEIGFSLETAREVRGLRLWVTNEYEHDGSRTDGARVFGRLVDLVRGEA